MGHRWEQKRIIQSEKITNKQIDNLYNSGKETLDKWISISRENTDISTQQFKIDSSIVEIIQRLISRNGSLETTRK